MNSIDDKRFYPRIEREIEVTFHTGDDRRGTAIVQDLSASGLSFEIEESIAEETSVKLNFFLKEMDKRIEATGKIIRATPVGDRYKIAIQFLEIPELDLIMMVDYTLANMD